MQVNTLGLGTCRLICLLLCVNTEQVQLESGVQASA